MSAEPAPSPTARPIETICVYCGSGSGLDPAFAEAARGLGRAMAERDIGLVYGGGSIGLMGEIARAVDDNGGRVIGIIPDFLTARENAFKNGELIVTRDMHERKRLMFDRADAFVALPGGIGTLEELVEQMTWAQLGQHRKPILLANVNGFWDPLRDLLAHMERMRFIRPGLTLNYLVEDRIEDVLPRLEAAAAAVPEDDKEITGLPVDRG